MWQTDVSVNLWRSTNCALWRETLESYPGVIAAQGNDRLMKLDEWYRNDLAPLIASRTKPQIFLDELQGIAAWKMTRGVWRERNRRLIAQNSPEEVAEASHKAFSAIPDPRKPISILSTLAGVGPATASAALAAYAPQLYPFFDELVAAQIPGLGPVAFTAKYYATYAELIRERASQLNAACPDHPWTAQDVSQALWAASGGKAAS